MTFEAEHNIYGHEYRIYQSEDGKYHVDMDERKDIHGPMPAEALINWMSHTIYGLSYALQKVENKNPVVKIVRSTDIVAQGGFNTGRLYSALGQRIFWAQRADGWLGFVDHDRMINGWIKREDPIGILVEPIIPAWLMGKYDSHAYTNGTPDGWNVEVPKNQEYEGLRL